MGTALAFDTLKLVDALEKVDLPRAQARAIVEVVRESRSITLTEQSTIAQDASARAVAELDSKTDKALALLRSETETSIALLRRDMETGFTAAEKSLSLLRSETETSVALLRKDMEAGFALMDKKIELVDQRSQARFKLLYWMSGGLMAALFAIAAALAPAALRMYFGG